MKPWKLFSLLDVALENLSSHIRLLVLIPIYVYSIPNKGISLALLHNYGSFTYPLIKSIVLKNNRELMYFLMLQYRIWKQSGIYVKGTINQKQK